MNEIVEWPIQNLRNIMEGMTLQSSVVLYCCDPGKTWAEFFLLKLRNNNRETGLSSLSLDRGLYPLSNPLPSL